MYKQIAIVSGKGGTGKTIITSALLDVNDNKIAADCDVDASNLNLLYDTKLEKQYDYYGGKKALIDNSKCISCGMCKFYCRFDAIKNINGEFFIDELSCEGCNRCVLRCPTKAIELIKNRSGEFYKSFSKDFHIIHANLDPGEETSGGLVAKVRKLTNKIANENNISYSFIDGSPGIGCPATSTITGVNFVVIVTEPTNSGIHDLYRIIDTINHFKRNFGIIINKFDINIKNTEFIENFCYEKDYCILGKIPFDEKIMNATINKTFITRINENYNFLLNKINNNILNLL